jgi:hypothetical protein
MSTYTRRFWITAALPAALLSGLPAIGQEKKKPEKADPLVGRWVLDPVQSIFTPGPAPGGRFMTFQAVENGYRHITRTTGGFAEDQTEYTVHFDGKDYPNDPISQIDTYSMKRVDANTIERTGKIRGKTVETATFQVSPDGKVLRVTVKGSIQGDDYSNTQVYARI